VHLWWRRASCNRFLDTHQPTRVPSLRRTICSVSPKPPSHGRPGSQRRRSSWKPRFALIPRPQWRHGDDVLNTYISRVHRSLAPRVPPDVQEHLEELRRLPRWVLAATEDSHHVDGHTSIGKCHHAPERMGHATRLREPLNLREGVKLCHPRRARCLYPLVREPPLDDVPLVGGKNGSLGEMYRELSAKACRFPTALRSPRTPTAVPPRGPCDQQIQPYCTTWTPTTSRIYASGGAGPASDSGGALPFRP